MSVNSDFAPASMVVEAIPTEKKAQEDIIDMLEAAQQTISNAKTFCAIVKITIDEGLKCDPEMHEYCHGLVEAFERSLEAAEA